MNSRSDRRLMKRRAASDSGSAVFRRTIERWRAGRSSGKVGDGRRAGAAGQDEFLEHGQVAVELFDQFFEAGDQASFMMAMPGRQFAAEVEQVVLDVEQGGTRTRAGKSSQRSRPGWNSVRQLRQWRRCAGCRGRPAAVAEAGGTGVAGAGDDLGRRLPLRSVSAAFSWSLTIVLLE